MRKNSTISFAIILAIGTCVAFGIPTASAKAVTLKAVAFLPKHIAAVSGMQMLTDRVNKQSNGEVIIKYLGGPEVIPPPALMEAVRTGKIDIAIQSSERFTDVVPELAILCTSELSPMEERENGAFEWIAKYLEKKMNVHYVQRANCGPGFSVYPNFPVSKVEDLAGKRFAARAQCYPFLRAMGAVPVDVGKGDWYAAVERGIVDGYSIPIPSVPAWGLLDITKYAIDAPFYRSSNVVIVVNLDKWNSLPMKHRKLMDEIGKNAEPDIIEFQMKKVAEARQKMINAGIKFIKLPPAEEKKFLGFANTSIWDDYKKKVSPEVVAEAKRLFTK